MKRAPRGAPHKAGQISALLRRAAAVARDAPLLAAAGTGTLEERAARLNLAGYRTPRGKLFDRAAVYRMVQRSGLMSQKP